MLKIEEKENIMSKIQAIVGAVALTVTGICASEMRAGIIPNHSQDRFSPPPRECTMVKALEADAYVKQGINLLKKIK